MRNLFRANLIKSTNSAISLRKLFGGISLVPRRYAIGNNAEETDMLRGLEKYYEDYCKSIRQEAEVLREGPMPVITEELFAVYENTGNRLIRVQPSGFQ